MYFNKLSFDIAYLLPIILTDSAAANELIYRLKLRSTFLYIHNESNDRTVSPAPIFPNFSV